MSDFFGKLKTGAGKIAFEADKLTRINRAKSELETLKRQLEELFSGLGKATYSQRTANETVDLSNWCVKIDEKKVRIKAQDQVVQIISSEVYNPAGASNPQTVVTPSQPAPVYPHAPAAATTEPMHVVETPLTAKFCPTCGQEVAPEVKFCNNCGGKI